MRRILQNLPDREPFRLNRSDFQCYLLTNMVSKTIKISATLVALVGILVLKVPDTITPPKDERSILLYDGVCNLCNAFVNFVADHDEKKMCCLVHNKNI